MGWLLIVAYGVLRHPWQFIKALIAKRREAVEKRQIEEGREVFEHLYGINPDTWDWFDKGDANRGH